MCQPKRLKMEQLRLNLWPSLEEVIEICGSRYKEAKPVGDKDLPEGYIWFIKEKSWEISLLWLYTPLELFRDGNSEYRLRVIESGRIGSKVLVEYVQRGDKSEIGKLYNSITQLKRPYQPLAGLRKDDFPTTPYAIYQI